MIETQQGMRPDCNKTFTKITVSLGTIEQQLDRLVKAFDGNGQTGLGDRLTAQETLCREHREVEGRQTDKFWRIFGCSTAVVAVFVAVLSLFS